MTWWTPSPNQVLTSLMMPWDTALNYADRGLRIVTSSGIAPSEQLQWWERKDRITRGAIAGLVRQRWPAQEALEQALADTNTDWTVVRGVEVKGIHTAMEQADQGLDLGKGAGRGKGGFRDQKWRGRFPTHADRCRAPVLLPNNSDKRAWNSQVEHKAPSDNPQEGQRRIGNSSCFTPSGKKLCGAFNSAKGCPDARKKRYTVATSSRRPMDVSVSQQTIWRTSTPFIGHLPPHSYGVVEATGNFTKQPSVYDRGSCPTAPLCQTSCVAWSRRFVASPLVPEVPRIGCGHQLVVWLWLCFVCIIGSRPSRHRVDNRTLG